jgi:hypothetical protein
LCWRAFEPDAGESGNESVNHAFDNPFDDSYESFGDDAASEKIVFVFD